MNSKDIVAKFESELKNANNEPLIEDFVKMLDGATLRTQRMLVRNLLIMELEFKNAIFEQVTLSTYQRPDLIIYSKQISDVFKQFKPKDPARLHEFEIDKVLGEGGMGKIYKAVHRSLERDVALKIMHVNNAKPREKKKWIRRFFKEARTVADIDGTATVYSMGIIEPGEQLPDGTKYDERTYFFAMKLIIGHNLHDIISSLSMRKQVHMIRCVAKTIDRINQKGIYHRDLKPANIMLENDDYKKPIVIDFGLARNTLSSDSMGTSPVGTLQFMSPEQAYPNFGDVSCRTDVHGLGGILYYALTNRAPYEGKFGEIFDHIKDPLYPIPPIVINPSIDSKLSEICSKCLKTNQSDRYQSAKEVSTVLRDWLKSTPHSPEPLPIEVVIPAQKPTPSSRFGLDKFYKDAKEKSDLLFKNLLALERGESTQPIRLDSNQFCEMAFGNGLSEVKHCFCTFTDWDCRDWFCNLISILPKVHNMMDNLKQNEYNGKMPGKNCILFYTHGNIKDEAGKLRMRLDTTAKENREKLIRTFNGTNGNLVRLIERGCEIRICNLDLDAHNYKGVIQQANLPQGVCWTLFDDLRFDFYRISSYGDFHDLQVYCKPMDEFQALLSTICPYYSLVWSDALPWSVFWDGIENVLREYLPQHAERKQE